MHINWRAILSGIVGGVVAAVVGGYALTTGVGSHPDSYTTSGMVWAAVATIFGGVGGTLAGWGTNGRREAGLSGIAAIASFLGSVGSTFAWASVVAPLTGTWTLLMWSVLMLGVSLIVLVIACGTTAAVLKPLSLQHEPEPVP